MFVIGIDSHKDTLMGCVIDQALHQVGTLCVPNTAPGIARLVAWAQETGAGRVAIEGSGHYGRPAAMALTEAGIEVVDVPPQMTSRQRRTQRTPVKNDAVDALLIAQVAAREENLPPPRPDGFTEDLRLLVGYRHELVETRTRQINRLHADLTHLRGDHPKLPTALTTPPAIDRVTRMLARSTAVRARIAKQRTRHIRSLNRQIRELTQQITTAVKTTGTTLTHIHGVGNLTAAEIITQVGNPARYPTKAKFAMANGTAPLEASSGRTIRHRLNRGGNRRINQALYTAALTQISRPGSEGHTYYQKQLTHGKTPKEAIRNLKRHISNRVYKHLQTPSI